MDADTNTRITSYIRQLVEIERELSEIVNGLARKSVVLGDKIRDLQKEFWAIEGYVPPPTEGKGCPPSNDGDPYCKHEWEDDGENFQRCCKKCPARYDVMISALPMVDTAFDPSFQFGDDVFLLSDPMTVEEFANLVGYNKRKVIPDLSICHDTARTIYRILGPMEWKPPNRGQAFILQLRHEFNRDTTHRTSSDREAFAEVLRANGFLPGVEDNDSSCQGWEAVRVGGYHDGGPCERLFAKLGASSDAGDDWGDGVGDVISSCTTASLNDKFPTPLMDQALDDAVVVLHEILNTPDSPEASAAVKEMCGSDLILGEFSPQDMAGAVDKAATVLRDELDGGDTVAVGVAYVPAPESDGKFEGALVGAYLKDRNAEDEANRWVTQG